MESQGGTAAPAEASAEPSADASSEPLTFDDFYRSEFRHVLGLAFVLTGNQWVAEETAQDAFTAAFRRWRSIVAYDSPGAWVRRVTCNQAASVLRRRVREAKALMRLAGRALDRVGHAVACRHRHLLFAHPRLFRSFPPETESPDVLVLLRSASRRPGAATPRSPASGSC